MCDRDIGPDDNGYFHCGLCDTWKPKEEMKPRGGASAHGVEGKCMACEKELQAGYRRMRRATTST